MRTLPVLVLAFVLTATGVLAQQDRGAAAARPGPGPLVFSVTASDTGKPLSDVCVHAAGRYVCTGADGSATIDGMSSGSIVVAVAHPGYAQLERELQLADGVRAPVRLTLEPAPMLPCNGSVTLLDQGGPVAGARILLTPVRVSGAQIGPLECATDFAGKFEIPLAPVGVYRADVSAVGCVSAVFEVTIAKAMPPLAWTLAPVVTAASLRVQVLDRTSRAPVAGAQVTVLESESQGVLAKGPAANGQATFAGLQTGVRNWQAATGSSGIGRGTVLVKAEAPGYETWLVQTTLVADAEATVLLNGTGVQEEVEPNDAMAAAQVVRTGAPVRFTISKRDDADFFRFRIPCAALVEVHAAANRPLELHAQLFDSAGRVITGAGFYPTSALSLWNRGLLPGEYVLSLVEWGQDTASPTPMEFTIRATPAADAFEPNETQESARPVRIGSQISGCLFPIGDRDWFRFEVTRPGVLRVQGSTCPFERHLIVKNLQRELARGGFHANTAMDLVVQVDPGVHWLALEEWANDAESLHPYRITLEQIEDDQIDDPAARPGAVTAVRVLRPNAFVANTIFPANDIDLYQIPIPSAGRLHVSFVGPLEAWMQIVSTTGAAFTTAGTYPRQIQTLHVDFAGPATCYADLREWGGGDASPIPCSVWTHFEPVDEAEQTGRNDSRATATPALLREPIRASFLPLRDVDNYQLDVDHPGVLHLDGTSPTEMHVILANAKGAEIARAGLYPGPVHLAWPVLPGLHFLELREWADDNSTPIPYHVVPTLLRAEPQESLPLAADPLRRLRPGEAQAYLIDQRGDLDRFVLDIPAAGKWNLRLAVPGECHVSMTDDRTGTLLHQQGLYAGNHVLAFEAKGPTRYRIELSEWANDSVYTTHAYVLADTKEARDMPREEVTGEADAIDGTKVTFRRTLSPGGLAAVAVDIDANGDGKPDLTMNGPTAQWRYASEGLYRCTAWLHGAEDLVSLEMFWVEAISPRERKGVQLTIDRPAEGQTLDHIEPMTVRAFSYSGRPIRRIDVSLDGKPVAAGFTSPFEAELPLADCAAGTHALVVKATDAGGDFAAVTRRFSVSEYFDLQPADASVVTGNVVRVSWTGRDFGAGRVRWRVKGAPDWQEAVGESGRLRKVTLEGLEVGALCEFQPVGTTEPGPVRTVTRVKGLAFGRPRYGATIKRDYDQRVGISVRNHAEKPLTVKLSCAMPPQSSKLLAGFVGDGSEGAPFVLAPGDEREFVLALSAQDCVQRHVTFPVRMVSDSGFSDEAEIAVAVQLPVVKLDWEDIGPAPAGIGRILRLRNNGDTLTDLAIAAANPDLTITPGITHGLFAAGQSLDVTVRPRLYEGFAKVTSALSATAVDKAVEMPLSIGLAPGESIHRVALAPTAATPEQAEAGALGRLGGAYLNPGVVDWSKKPNPSDTDGDGRMDRWEYVDLGERVHWIGEDTDGDDSVDFVHADAGLDGRFDFSAIKGAKGWEETNLASGWLEMGFKLPAPRRDYEKHDADIVFNKTVIGKLRDVIPEGNYAFRIPPSAFAFGAGGAPAENSVEVQSRHLRGGHYVVSSDFRVKLELTGTDVLTVAKDAEEAKKHVAQTPGLTASVPDLSVSSAEVRLPQTLPPAGKPLTVGVTLRNLGAAQARHVDVALVRDAAGTSVEIGRTVVPEVPAGGSVPVEITAPAPAGDVALRVVVDPDALLADSDRDNNVATTGIAIPGDTEKPQLAIAQPAGGAVLTSSIVPIAVTATGKQAIARAEARIDGGLWLPLTRTTSGYGARALMQPGAHKLTVRCVDVAGNVAERSVDTTVHAPAPTVAITQPLPGAQIDARTVAVTFTCGPSSKVAAVRVNGGPWKNGAIRDGTSVVEVPLQFGAAVVEAAAVDATGVRATASVTVRCTKQPEPDQPPPPAAADTKPPPLEVPGLGPVDPLGTGDTLVPPEEGAVTPPTGKPDTAQEPEPDDAELAAACLPQGPVDPAVASEIEAEEAALANGDDPIMSLDDLMLDPNADWSLPPELAGQDLEEDMNWQPADLESWDGAPVDEPESASGGEGSSPPPPPPPAQTGSAAGGGYVAVQQRQSDWYCTNRPNIGVKFQLPDWLKRLNLPKPGTAEFEAAFRKQIDKLKASGVDTAGIEKFRDILRNHCKRLDSPGELPTFLQSLGLQKPPDDDPAKLKAWRENMANAADSFVLRLLSSGDPQLIAAGLRARADSLRQFDQAASEAADAAVDTIKANQKIVEDVAMTLPYANTAIGLVTLYTGETLSGETLGTGAKALNAIFTLGPGFMKLFRNPSVRGTAAMIGNKAMWAGQKTLATLAQKLGLQSGRLGAAMKSLANGVAETRRIVGEALKRRAEAAAAFFGRTPAGQAAAKAAARDTANGHALLGRIAKAQAAGNKAEYRRLIGMLQGNKTAQRLLNASGGTYSNEFRAALDKTHRAMQRLTDRRAIPEILKSPGAQKEIDLLLKKFPGLKREDIVIRAANVSGNAKTLATIKPGELLKYGSDRDVVFQYMTRDGKLLRDVHHDVAAAIYSQRLKEVTGFTAEQLDHVVTSRWHPEAYNPGFFASAGARGQEIKDIISGQAAGRLQRASDIRDTIIHKGSEWMERGDHFLKQGNRALGNQQTAEGMRQVGKEFKRQVEQMLTSKGLSAQTALPARLRQGLEIFEAVGQGRYNVDQARQALAALTPKGGMPVTPQTIAQDLGYFVEFVNKWGTRVP